MVSKRSTMIPYWCRAWRAFMLTASRPSETGVTSGPMPAWCPSRRPRRSGESIWASSTRLPAWTAARASAAATVVRPTPPLPDRMKSRRSRRLSILEPVLEPQADGDPRPEDVHVGAVLGVQRQPAERQHQLRVHPEGDVRLDLDVDAGPPVEDRLGDPLLVGAGRVLRAVVMAQADPSAGGEEGARAAEQQGGRLQGAELAQGQLADVGRRRGDQGLKGAGEPLEGE